MRRREERTSKRLKSKMGEGEEEEEEGDRGGEGRSAERGGEESQSR